MTKKAVSLAVLLVCLLTKVSFVWSAPPKAAKVDRPAVAEAVRERLTKSRFRFTTEVESAFLDNAKDAALKKLAALPAK